MKYPKLFSPLKFNSIMLKNRIMSAPMGVVDSSAMISSTFYGGISLYDKSLGGSGIVYVPMDNNSPVDGVLSKYQREVTREIVYVLKQAGAKAGAEVMFHSRKNANGYFWGPVSGIRYDGAKMEQMSPNDMAAFSSMIASHCKALKDFGFDTILLAFGHDSLCSQFLSPKFNTRTDNYGGSLENRIRFAKETIIKIREAVGKDFPLNMRLSRNLMVPEDYDENDMLYFIKQIEDYVDMVNISTGMDGYGGTYNKYIANIHSCTTAFFPHMYSLQFAEKVKQNCNVLVSIVGGVLDPQECEEAIAQNKIDAVMIGRGLTADPFWPKKAQNDQDDDIVPCIRCNNCFHFTTEHKNVVCSVNPRFRREKRVPLKIEKTDNPKNVIVVGGGPAGLKAAITLYDRGHKVTILEKTDKLGGRINCCDYSNLKIDLKRYRNYLLKQVEKRNIEIKYNFEANAENIKVLNPEAIYIAVGSDPIKPRIDGVDSDHVLYATDIFENGKQVSGNVAIIGGGSVGCELAMELSDKVKHVDVIEYADNLAMASNITYRLSLEYMFPKYSNVTINTSSKVTSIQADKVLVETKYDGNKEILADYVVLAVGFKPKSDLVESLYGICPDTFVIGDCDKVASVCEATNNAYFTAINL